MNSLAAARRTAFWTLDRVRGGEIAHGVADVSAALERPRSAATTALRRARTTRLLEHAARATSFWAGCDPSNLASFPVTDKMTYRDHRDAMLVPDRTGLRVVRTSGSTGTPFEALQDRVKVRRNQADTIATLARAGVTLGMPLLYFRSWSNQHSKSLVRGAMEGVTKVDVLHLDAERARAVLARIRRSPVPVALLGYGSGIEELCRALDDGEPGVGDRVGAVVASGEAPSEYLRSAVPRHFGRPLVARYSNTENGILAIQDSGSPGYRINVASYWVEVLQQDRDEPAAPGETGRIVLTDLFNRVMPFIRYDTGDLGSFACDADGDLDDTVLASLAGRVYDQLTDTRGRNINPMAVPDLETYRDIRQFQLAQTGPGSYTLRLNAEPDSHRDRRVRAELLSVLGRDADLAVAYVDGVPLMRSGKRRIIVQEWARP